MKKATLFWATLLIMSSVGIAHAQTNHTIFGNEAQFGGFGGPAFTFTTIDGQFAAVSGGRGGGSAIFASGRAIHFGGGGYGLLVPIKNTSNAIETELSIGYGVFEFEYVQNRRRAVHLSWALALGSGSATETTDLGSSSLTTKSSFFLIEPGIAFNANLAPNVRARAAAGYRLVSGTSLPNYNDQSLSGPSLMISFLFGFWP